MLATVKKPCPVQRYSLGLQRGDAHADEGGVQVFVHGVFVHGCDYDARIL